jgi:hypothetical protein
LGFATITVSDWGAGYPVSPTKVKALAFSITKRNLDFLRVGDFGKGMLKIFPSLLSTTCRVLMKLPFLISD